MKKRMVKVIVICMCVMMGMTGCSDKTKKESTDLNEETDVVSVENGNINFFPETYSEQIGNVKFDCTLEIPENFDALNFYMPKVNGYSFMDNEKIYQTYVEGKEIKEEYHDPEDAVADYQNAGDFYILSDDTLIGITGTLLYNRSAVTAYLNASREDENGAPKDTFNFGSAEDCISDLKSRLKEVGCPVEQYQFDWFSTSGEEHASLESQMVETQMLDSQNRKRNGWSEADDSYDIYAWQTYEALPVFPLLLTQSKRYIGDTYKKAPLTAVYTAQGALGISLIYPPFAFEKTNETVSFLSFEDIADVVVQKYDELLEDEDIVHNVTSAKLFLRTYYDESQRIEAEPVWYFQVSDGTNTEPLLIQAISGEEIPLIN